LICIDLEASGLARESYPIEIAWKCTKSGASDCFLINPDTVPEWHYWDECAEELHGIEPDLLQREGISADQACFRLNRVLAGKDVVSDAVEYDGFWLRRLFDACDIRQGFRLAGLESVLSAEERIQYHFIAGAAVRRHRALQDVEDLISAITAAQSGVEG
jgi:hypothetical protein